MSEEKPTAREIVVDGVGYIGGAEAWDLKRRLLGGGLDRMAETVAKSAWAGKVGGAALICTGAGGCLTSIGCMLNAIIGGHFMVDAMACWTGLMVGGGMVGAGFVALDLSGKATASIDAAKAAAVVQVALSPVPPTPTPEVGLDQKAIDDALAVLTAPPDETPVPK